MTKVHISLKVKDVAASARFYQAFLGVAPHKLRPGYANFDVDEPPLKLALNESAYEGRGSLDHLGFVVDKPDAVKQARERMVAAGLATFSEEEVTCCYATQDKVWVTDPDGHSWEGYVLLDDMLYASFEGKTMNMLPSLRQAESCEMC
jgi:catechol 2,3-dioxygenase-like lactoylglutathione lyase family enzyme